MTDSRTTPDAQEAHLAWVLICSLAGLKNLTPTEILERSEATVLLTRFLEHTAAAEHRRSLCCCPRDPVNPSEPDPEWAHRDCPIHSASSPAPEETGIASPAALLERQVSEKARRRLAEIRNAIALRESDTPSPFRYDEGDERVSPADGERVHAILDVEFLLTHIVHLESLLLLREGEKVLHEGWALLPRNELDEQDGAVLGVLCYATREEAYDARSEDCYPSRVRITALPPEVPTNE